jgi:hypothetical protein
MPKQKKTVKQDTAPMPEGMEARKTWLIERAKKDGHISQKDILAAIPDTAENTETLDQLYTALADVGVPVSAAERGRRGAAGRGHE